MTRNGAFSSRSLWIAAGLVLCLVVSACARSPATGARRAAGPQLAEATPAGQALATLPGPSQPVYAAVYDFRDLTGSRKPNDNFAEYSSAVTQGASEYLSDALYRAGGGSWFEVVERGGLEDLLQERQVIRATRQQFEGQGASPLPPLKFAGVLIRGGVVAYDSNLVTGGVGARYLGVGGSTQYRRDRVTVVMRAVSVKSGTVLASVSTSKTIYSKLVEGSVFSFVSFDEILELEAGVSRNEPPQLAVRQAIELAVYALVMEGASRGVWGFQTAAGEELVQRYLASKAGQGSPTLITEPSKRRGLRSPFRRGDRQSNVAGAAAAPAAMVASPMLAAPAAPSPIAQTAIQSDAAPMTMAAGAPSNDVRLGVAIPAPTPQPGMGLGNAPTMAAAGQPVDLMAQQAGGAVLRDTAPRNALSIDATFPQDSPGSRAFAGVEPSTAAAPSQPVDYAAAAGSSTFDAGVSTYPPNSAPVEPFVQSGTGAGVTAASFDQETVARDITAGDLQHRYVTVLDLIPDGSTVANGVEMAQR